MARTLLGAVLVGALLAGLAGCGGSQLATGEDPIRGEGNIPIGRMPNRETATVHVTDARGRRFPGEVRDGIIWTPPLINGPATVVVTPTDRTLRTVVVPFVVGPNQRHVMSVRPLPLRGSLVGTDVRLNIVDGATFDVGEIVELKVTINGQVNGEFGPTVWLNGGVAALDLQGRVVMLESGTGSIVIDFKGNRQTFRFTVR